MLDISASIISILSWVDLATAIVEILLFREIFALNTKFKN